jgi:hypothetical protein
MLSIVLVSFISMANGQVEAERVGQIVSQSSPGAANSHTSISPLKTENLTEPHIFLRTDKDHLRII